MNAATLLGTSGPLSYYCVPGSNRTINIDPTVTAKAFLISSGGAVTQLNLTDSSIYMLNQSGNLSLFNDNSQLASATGTGGGIAIVNYTNISTMSSGGSLGPSLLLAISPGMPPSTSEVSIAGVGLIPNSIQNGKNYYIVKNSGNIRFNTTKPKTIYYVGAGGQGGNTISGGQGGNTTSGGNAFRGGIVTYSLSGVPCRGGIYNNAVEYDRASEYSVDSSDFGNVDLHGGGGGGAGGGGGGAGAVGKIVVRSNYLNCTISSTSTAVYTEDKYLGTAGAGGDGLHPSYRSGNAAPLTNFNPAVLGGGGGGVASTVQASGGSVLNSYIGTTVIPGRQGYRGGDGGRGQTEGFEVLHTDQYGNTVSTWDRSQIALGGGGGVNAGAGGQGGDNVYTTNLDARLNIFKQYMSTGGHVTGRDGAAGTNGSGFGAGKGGKPGGGGEGVLIDWYDVDNSYYRAKFQAYQSRIDDVWVLLAIPIDLFRTCTGASGGGGGGGGNGAPGFSLDAAEGTTGLDAQGDSNGCVIIVVG